LLKLKRRIELEDILKNKDNWKAVKDNCPCTFQAKYGKVMCITKTKPKEYFMKVDDYYVKEN